MAEGSIRNSEEIQAEAEKLNLLVDEGIITPNQASKIETDQTPEKVEAEIVARKKLEMLMDPNFREFGARFMNIQEYQHMLAERRTMPNEVYVFGRLDWKPSFSELLAYDANNERKWENQIYTCTKWDFSLSNIKNAYKFISLLRSAHRDAQNIQSPRRDHTMDIFREKIQKWLDGLAKGGWDSDKNTITSLIMVPSRADENYDPERAAIVRYFYDDPNWLKQKGNLKKLYHALSDAPYPKYFTDSDEWRQYHLMAIFEMPAIDFSWDRLGGHWGDTSWQTLNPESSLESHLLGAVSMMPDKETWNQMTDASTNSCRCAHPVFTNNGQILFPK